MQVRIEYCKMWNYQPQAASLAERLQGEFDDQVQIKLVEGSGGCFEVDLDGDRVYSKLETGSFPEEAAIVKIAKQRL